MKELQPDEYSRLLHQFKLDEHLSEQIQVSGQKKGSNQPVLAKIYYKECIQTLDELITTVGVSGLADYLATKRRLDLFFRAICDSPHLTQFIEKNKPITIYELDNDLREKVISTFVIRVLELYDKGNL